MIIVDWNYLSLPREKRRSHLDLNQPCLERGGNSTVHKGVLAQFLNTNLPNRLKEGRVCLCHACHNGNCSNPLHLYWGTDVDNTLDQQENGTLSSPYERTLRKYGSKETRKILEHNGRKAIRKFNEETRKNSTHINHTGFSQEEVDSRLILISDIDLTQFGWVSKVSERLNITHTQARRFINKHYNGEVYSRKSPLK
jgi:hypothetical protein